MKGSFLGRSSAGLAIVACLALGIVPSAFAIPPTTVHCGQVITQDTKLADDLAGCTGNGLVIGSDGITLDLNGYTISGVGNVGDSEEAGVVNPGFDGVTVKNGTITLFIQMINAGVSDVTGMTIRHITGEGIFGDVFVTGDGNVIEKSTFLGSNDSALFVAGDRNVITKNLLVGNNDIAILIGRDGTGNVITKNTIRAGNRCEAFIDANQDNVIEKNDTSATGGLCTDPSG
jgi:hypothetical protein